MELLRNITDRAAAAGEIEHLRPDIIFRQHGDLALQPLDLELGDLETESVAFLDQPLRPWFFGFHIRLGQNAR
jgi:hypothetical protein